MNRVVLCGRLVRDPDVKYSTGEKATCVARFTLACDRKYKKDGEQNADFISCLAFGKTGEFVEKYLTKGTKIMLEGRWQTGSYTNKEGQKVYTNECVVDGMEFSESKKAAAETTPPAAPDDFMSGMGDELTDDELPFA